VPSSEEQLRPLVHLATPVPSEIEEAIARDFELISAASGADGIVATPAVTIDAAYLAGAGAQLRIVANYAVGTDNVDLEHARDVGVVVTNTPDVLTQATAELTIGLMLALLRRICEGDRMIRRRDRWQIAPEFMLGAGLAGREVLIVGPGRIGRKVAELVDAHGAHVLFAGRGDDLVSKLPHADVVTMHCPLTPETHHLIDAHALGAMKPSAVLVNTARGQVVNEQALATALHGGALAGAALDVYEFEPHVTEELLELDNVVLTPHIASATRETRLAMGMLCVEALRAVLLEGRAPPNAV
jgi:glyoxylate reductase